MSRIVTLDLDHLILDMEANVDRLRAFKIGFRLSFF